MEKIEIVLDEKTLQNIEYIKLNTKRMAEASEKQATAMENIANALIDEKGNSFFKFLNWNLGKIVAHLTGDKKTLKEIADAEAEGKGVKKK